MNKTDPCMQEKWKAQKHRLMLKFSTLTDEDVFLPNDKQAEMFLRLQLKMGRTKEQLCAIISAL